MVRTLGGIGSSRTTISVAIPNMPSLPTKRPTRSGPHGSPCREPSRSTLASGSMTSSSTTWLVVTPYLRQCGSARVLGDVPADGACGLAGRVGHVVQAVRRHRLGEARVDHARLQAWRGGGPGPPCRIRFSRVSATSTASGSATAPPESPVPAPRATNGVPVRCIRRSSSRTSAAEPGITTTPGYDSRVGRPSMVYVASSARRWRTHRGPTMRPSASTISGLMRRR